MVTEHFAFQLVFFLLLLWLLKEPVEEITLFGWQENARKRSNSKKVKFKTSLAKYNSSTQQMSFTHKPKRQVFQNVVYSTAKQTENLKK